MGNHVQKDRIKISAEKREKEEWRMEVAIDHLPIRLVLVMVCRALVLFPRQWTLL